MGKRDAYRANTDRMAAALSGIGWTVEVQGMGGGTYGVVVRPGDGPDLLVSASGWFDSASEPWLVGLFCQSHPEYGTDEGTAYVPWSSWETLPGAVSVALHTLRTLPVCPCPDHTED